MEEVVLVDDDGNRVGTADKATVHHRDTPLHLAFSAYVFDRRGELLLTRRATAKRTWPGTWTNSCCGHPLPGEPLPDAVARRLKDELGLTATAIDLVLPRFRYRAAMPNGIVENELCPVYRVTADGVPALEPAEVADAAWVSWETLVTAVRDGGLVISPWCREQVAELRDLADDPRDWRAAGPAELPAAARATPGR
ncbi:MAG: isopentenyl-diphosphate Delta-isomerase [Streptosporangiales bacterium]|nr:isopentenyl-diphosphate Delta-isomerase [Streptosporangiales bacterium]